MSALNPGTEAEIRRVIVIGAGQIGSGLAQACARGGVEVVVVDPDGYARARARERIQGWLHSKAIDREVSCVATLAQAGAADLIVEATPEDRDTKIAVLGGIAGCDDATIIATTTSALPIADLAAATDRPDRFLGMHVFYPVPAMPVVELIPSADTADAVVRSVAALIEGPLGKTTVAAPDRPGFIVNALVIPYVVAAVRLHQETGASASEIDILIRGAVGNPLGPLQLADFMGIDTLRNIAGVLHRADPVGTPRPPALLDDMVASGHLGRKSGQGFYVY
ncbi:3-hydroxyacyl-CoA dehydrogenase family protein [Mycolicibacterium tokaiense]|uniref:3-hydroxyacyl-CoA dehydrogenase n=1 Tax=Mycolicibacterium tokaiense TaxID=39695 RepID=A0A378T853_9MYCO|nr:3-hydroxyacyl-CoA dehydrogenase NAD-binding domain-containing protein [Mycolicibacterium tokaiense]BBY88538.1 3-hydroxybutyryl-CoA dehydrogenase [Mycolicibacterium tokaiense]STZ56939.1 3-hydroxyacyl-CoA dehydrogenase [Mycolicibacterium tokaiense]